MTDQKISVRKRVIAPLKCGSKVEQHHKGETNINSIISRYNRTGLLPERGNPGFYGDFVSIGDYQDCVNRVHEAQQQFMTLPSDLRRAFDNDPGRLLQFLNDPNNREKAMELGIIPYPEPEQPAPPASDTESDPSGEE